MSAVVKKKQRENNTRKNKRVDIRDELAIKMFDMLVKEELINPENFTIEELELLLSEVFIDVKRRFEMIK